MRKRQIHDRMAECTPFRDKDGNRALHFWPGFHPSFVSPHLRMVSSGWVFVLNEDEWAQRVMEALADPDTSSEREMAMLRRMSTEEEWALAEALHDEAKRQAGTSDR